MDVLIDVRRKYWIATLITKVEKIEEKTKSNEDVFKTMLHLLKKFHGNLILIIADVLVILAKSLVGSP